MAVKTIYFAGGCFWGVEEFFRRKKGVQFTLAGYINGKTEETSYYEIHHTGHAEAVKVSYDNNIISLITLLENFFSIIDPRSVNRQGNDIGTQYRTGIYYISEKDLFIIDKFIKSLKIDNLAVEIEPLRNFIEAEEYHQQYLLKNPNGYCHIKLLLSDN